MNRRQFVAKGSAAAFAASAFSQTRSANDTIRVGIVGPGGRGTSLLRECIEFGSKFNARLVAACDIWTERREAAGKRLREAYGAEPKLYNRYHDMLADKDLDAVIIATPDHQHAKMLKAAVESGKDAYCEKPMGNVLSETNEALDAVRRTGRVVQLGTQRRSYPKFRAAARILQSGRIGDIIKVEQSFNTYSPYRWSAKPEAIAALKENDTNWKEFLYGKPDRPFDPRIYRSFRLFREFSSGIIDQWMTHAIDAIHFITGESYPMSAMADGGVYRWKDYRENPDTLQTALNYGFKGKPFLVSYGVCLANGAGAGARVLGTRGTMLFEDAFRVSGEGSKDPEALTAAEEIADDPAVHHMANWLDCVRRRDPKGCYAPVDAGYGHSIACIMATDSLWAGRRMTFDPQRRTIQAG
ncbi:MAG: Gfo/Idh/MocA family protein [Bryobacteraceae bacterium]